LLQWRTEDEAKNKGNKQKHGISFEEAQTVFLDENARDILIRIIPQMKTVF
jgi:uncharacterized DUF497 family protein